MDNTASFQYDLFTVSYDEFQDISAMSPQEVFFMRIASPDARQSVTSAFNTALSRLDPESEAMIKATFADAASMLYLAAHEPNSVAAKRDEWSDDQNIAYFDFCHDSLTDMLAAIDPQTALSLSSMLKSAIDYIDAHTRPVKFGMVLPKLTDLQRALAEDEFNAIVRALSSRARNMIVNNSIGMVDCINIAYNHNTGSYRFRNAGVNTISEIAERFRPFYDFVINIPGMSPRELHLSHASRLMPFLSDEQVEWVTDCHERMGYFPLLYIIRAFYTTAQGRHDSVFALYHGFRGQRKTRAEVGKHLGITNERARQILVAYELPQELRPVISQHIDHYSHLRLPVLNMQAISTELIDMEFGTTEDTRQDITIESLLASLKLMLGGDIVHFHERRYLCSDTFLKHFDLSAALKGIEEAFASRRSSTVAMLVSSFVTPHLTPGVDAPELEYLIELVSSIVADTFAIPVVQAPCFLLSQNSVAVESEIFTILAEAGCPMRLKDIQKTLSQKFPFRDFSRLESLRGYLIRSERIIAIGKTSTYALRDWDIDTLTIREHIYNIIDSSPCPLSINDINDKLSEKGLSRTWTNIYSTIFTDSRRGYARYNNSLFGIASKSYPAEYKRTPMKVKDKE